jgi:hypothetical protein
MEYKNLVFEKTGASYPSTYTLSKQIDRQLTGMTNPSWKRQIALGQNATTPMNASEYQVNSHSPMIGEVSYPGWYTHHISTDIALQALPSISGLGSLQSAADNIARTIAYERLGSSVKLLVSLGELKETIRMIKHPAKALRRSLMDYYRKMGSVRRQIARSGKRGRHKRFRDTISETWLEYSFGVAPLVSDVQAGLDAYRNRADRPEYEVFKSGNLQKSRTARYEILSSGTVGFAWRCYAQDENSALVVYRGAAFNKIQTSCGLASFGLWPSEFVPAAWELIPWSFAIDYFTNIGDVLNSWATAQRVDFAWTSKTIVLKQNRKYSIECFPSPGWTFAGADGKGDISYKTVSRGSYSNLPLPSVGLSVYFNEARFLNIAALSQLRLKDIKWRP